MRTAACGFEADGRSYGCLEGRQRRRGLSTHDQSKTLEQINQHLQASGYFKKFPPEGIEVVSWYVMMGVGQVVTLRVPPERLREVNRAIEESAWGGFRTEFYPTYDFKAIAAQQRN